MWKIGNVKINNNNREISDLSYKINYLEESINILKSYVSVITEMSSQFEILHKDVSNLCVLDKE